MVQIIDSAPAEDGNVSLHIRGGAGLNSTGKIVATLLTAIESLTGVPCDMYADAITASLAGKGPVAD